MSNEHRMSKTIDEQIDELRHAVREGLSNHTGEFANPWIFKKNYSHEELADILEDIMASKRLFDNMQRLILADRKKHELQAKKNGFYMAAGLFGADISRIEELWDKCEKELEKL